MQDVVLNKPMAIWYPWGRTFYGLACGFGFSCCRLLIFDEKIG